jgi:hypothetical protein
MKDKEQNKREALARKAVAAIEAELMANGWGINFVIADNQGGYTSGNIGVFSCETALRSIECLGDATVQYSIAKDPNGTQRYLEAKRQEMEDFGDKAANSLPC